MSSKIVLFELNETPWRVIHDHVERHPTGALATMILRGASYETVAEDRILTPWSTWSTVHRGVDDATHGITVRDRCPAELDRVHPPLWSLLRAEGLRVGVFGSLHSDATPTDRRGVAFHVPDAPADAPHAASNEPSAAPRTLASMAGRLLQRRRDRSAPTPTPVDDPARRFDAFMRLLDERNPDLATFFTGHVAWAMHRFWAAAYPGDFTDRDDDDAWRRLHRDAIATSMLAVDGMLARLLRWAESDAEREVWITTSMGQAALRSGRRARTQLQLVHVDGFMAHLGLGTRDFVREVAAAPQVVVRLDAARAERFLRHAREIEFAPGQRLGVDLLGGDRYRVVVPPLQDHGDGKAMVRGERVTLRSLGFCHVAVADGSVRTAEHVPEGAMIVHRRGAAGGGATLPPRRISTLEVAPMLLRGLGVTPPRYMRTGELRCGLGQSAGHRSPQQGTAANAPPARAIAVGDRSR